MIARQLTTVRDTSSVRQGFFFLLFAIKPRLFYKFLCVPEITCLYGDDVLTRSQFAEIGIKQFSSVDQCYFFFVHQLTCHIIQLNGRFCFCKVVQVNSQRVLNRVGINLNSRCAGCWKIYFFTGIVFTDDQVFRINQYGIRNKSQVADKNFTVCFKFIPKRFTLPYSVIIQCT